MSYMIRLNTRDINPEKQQASLFPFCVCYLISQLDAVTSVLTSVKVTGITLAETLKLAISTCVCACESLPETAKPRTAAYLGFCFSVYPYNTPFFFGC